MKNKIWTSITHRLNDVDGGVLKSSLKWAKSWADMKVYAKSRAKMAISGQAPQNARRPTDLDRRILTVIGQEDLLIGWENALTEYSNSNSARQLPLEHDYEITGFQEVDENVDINFLDETEERLEQDDFNDMPAPSSSGSRTNQKSGTIREIRQAFKRFNESDALDTMEFYIDEEHAEEVHVIEGHHREVVTVIPPPPQRKKIKKEHPSSLMLGNSSASGSGDGQTKKDDQFAQAMMTLADAMNNVASALYAVSETLKTIKR